MIENKQRAMPQEHDRHGLIRVHSVFLTIQGEGPHCGHRALFIRLFGCNLRCPGCDTDYTSQSKEVNDSFMLGQAQIHLPPGGLVVITGGEPLRQNIAPSVWRLLTAGFRVQIETNGVLWDSAIGDLLHSFQDTFSIVCSPKTSRIHEQVLHHAAAFKYVLQAGQVDVDGLPLRALQHAASPRVARPREGAPVYVQPMDEADPEANALNLAAAIGSVMKHGHVLQVQVHKIINME